MEKPQNAIDRLDARVADSKVRTDTRARARARQRPRRKSGRLVTLYLLCWFSFVTQKARP